MSRPVNDTARVGLALGTVILVLSSSVHAHPGHGIVSGGFWAGLTHPLFGLDHMLAMIAIGFWSLNQAPAFRSMAPLFAALGMAMGALFAWAGLVVPGVEFGIAMTVLLTGVLVAAVARVPTVPGASIVVLFLFCHGQAHGAEMPAGIAPWEYLAGFIAATLFITYMARWLGQFLMSHNKRIVQLIGATIMAAGAFFAIS